MKQPAKTLQPAVAKKKALPAQPTSSPFETPSGLPELFAASIKNMYWAENHLVKSLPKMVNAAGAPALKKAFADHVTVTKNHAKRLERVLELLGEKIQAKKCDGVEGLTMDGEHIIENTLPGSAARDTGLIMAGLKTENFEITSYNGLIELAGQLGKDDIAELLRQNLADEMEADDLLTSLSRNEAPKKTLATPVKKSK